ncbi:TRZ/ATZ family hydrolase [Simiduia sp. 21SJ11W-1]|uniref:TRZ/ATZ family hydrolase n=1 Tax=Simiduia sp. 21SJ11W-1 TaxID=2909669 RepID=UPI00209EEE0E|nr:TRZ/ATZ family hydrolase [Simiduia sp. 21SJ11W-1]UTA49518.1 TRZ/ATZ family hydrolase [Simiduia sp. 21SJ11W-1]
MTKKTVDTAIYPRWLAPVDPTQGRILRDSCLIINQGAIVDICSAADAQANYTANEEIRLPGHLVIPGLINAHGHAAMSLLRGYADDLPLKPWLEEHIWPAEAAHVSDAFVREGTELAIAEMLLGGTTCFSDMYFFPEAAAAVAEAAGMRAQICIPVMEFPTPWASGPAEYLAKGEQLLAQYQGHETVSMALGPHAPYTVSDDTFTRLKALADSYHCPIQVHLHETAHEVTSALAESGERPSQRLAKLGILAPSTQCVHMTQLDDSDIALLKRTGAQVVHCPESNMKLASGICPSAKLIDAGVNICLGTDGAASNNDLNMLGEMRTAAFLGKVAAGDPAVMGADTLLAMATINGAKALGIDHLVGSLSVGKRADIAAIALDDLQFAPLYDPIAHLLYTECAHKVSHVWVDGKLLVQERKLNTLNAENILHNAQQWQARISAAAKDSE